MRKIVIREVEYNLVYNLKGLFTYESITGHSYTGKHTIDSYMLMYSSLVANNREFSITFEDFISICDSDPSLYITFVEVMTAEANRQAAILTEAADDKKKV